MKAQDFLAEGETVLFEDGINSFTDRRVFTLYRNGFDEISYEQISSIEYRMRYQLAPIIAGVIVLMVGLFLWSSPLSLFKSLGVDPTLGLTLFLVLAIILIGIGLALTQRSLVLRTTSGTPYYLRVKGQEKIEGFLRQRGKLLASTKA